MAPSSHWDVTAFVDLSSAQENNWYQVGVGCNPKKRHSNQCHLDWELRGLQGRQFSLYNLSVVNVAE